MGDGWSYDDGMIVDEDDDGCGNLILEECPYENEIKFGPSSLLFHVETPPAVDKLRNEYYKCTGHQLRGVKLRVEEVITNVIISLKAGLKPEEGDEGLALSEIGTDKVLSMSDVRYSRAAVRQRLKERGRKKKEGKIFCVDTGKLGRKSGELFEKAPKLKRLQQDGPKKILNSCAAIENSEYLRKLCLNTRCFVVLPKLVYSSQSNKSCSQSEKESSGESRIYLSGDKRSQKAPARAVKLCAVDPEKRFMAEKLHSKQDLPRDNQLVLNPKEKSEEPHNMPVFGNKDKEETTKMPSDARSPDLTYNIKSSAKHVDCETTLLVSKVDTAVSEVTNIRQQSPFPLLESSIVQFSLIQHVKDRYKKKQEQSSKILPVRENHFNQVSETGKNIGWNSMVTDVESIKNLGAGRGKSKTYSSCIRSSFINRSSKTGFWNQGPKLLRKICNGHSPNITTPVSPDRSKTKDLFSVGSYSLTNCVEKQNQSLKVSYLDESILKHTNSSMHSIKHSDPNQLSNPVLQGSQTGFWGGNRKTKINWSKHVRTVG